MQRIFTRLKFINRVNMVNMCDRPGWVTTFADHFEGASLNASRWTVRNNMTHGPQERQLYLSDEVWVENGHLMIRTRKNAARSPNGTMYNFTSGWVDSAGLVFQRFGRFDISARLPSPLAGRPGKWPIAWPAAWLMPEPSTSHPPNVCWPVGGEIDIMEGFTHNRPGADAGGGGTLNSIYLSYHWATECGKDLWDRNNGWYPARSDNATRIDWTALHTFTVEWDDAQIIWYVDGVQAHRRTTGDPASLFVPQWPMYLILNTALTPWADPELDSGLPLLYAIDRVTLCQPDTAGTDGTGQEVEKEDSPSTRPQNIDRRMLGGFDFVI